LYTISVRPEVVVTADRIRVGLGDTITLSCTVTRTNPETDGNYVWTSPSGIVTNGTSNTLVVAIQDFGTYTCDVTNTAGVTGTGNLTIGQGCKLIIIIIERVATLIMLILGSSTNGYDCPASPSCGC
jgi:hypothetical protein